VLRLSTAAKLTIARALRRVVGVWLSFSGSGADGRQVVCTRQGVRWCLDLDEGVQLALYLGVYERSTTRALARMAPTGAVVVDIGANIGAQALPLAHRLGPGARVIAVEPADSAVARLRANLELNPDLATRVKVCHRALGAAGDSPAGSYFARWPLTTAPGAHPVHQGAPEQSTAAAATLDRLVEELGLDRVDLIKLDVDGNEMPVLRGATATLARHQPVVVFELAPYLLEERGDAPSALPQLLIDYGYRLYDEDTLAALPTDLGLLMRSIPAGGSRNVIASVGPVPPRA
jgi:FkbM family methyltransferase